MNNYDLTGKTAWVCGASQGIGAATATLLAQRGADVTLIARREEVLNTLCESLNRQTPGTHHVLALDLADLEALPDRIATGLDATPTVHILVNNSGGPAPGKLVEAEAGAFLSAVQQHVMASHLLVQGLLPGMRAAQYGRILNVLSTSVKAPIDNLGVSNTTRAAVANWAKTLANEVGPLGITVNNVLPGFTATERLDKIIQKRADSQNLSPDQVAQNMKKTVPLRRFATPEETAEALAFLASPAAAYINGINLPVDGGRLASL